MEFVTRRPFCRGDASDFPPDDRADRLALRDLCSLVKDRAEGGREELERRPLNVHYEP